MFLLFVIKLYMDACDFYRFVVNLHTLQLYLQTSVFIRQLTIHNNYMIEKAYMVESNICQILIMSYNKFSLHTVM